MSSKNIILKYSKKNFLNANINNNINKNLNIKEKDKEILKEYFKENFNNIYLSDFLNILISKYLKKISTINNFIKSEKYVKIRDTSFNYVFLKLIGPFVIDEIFLNNKTTAKERKDRYDLFFNLQTKLNSKKIFSLINYQYVFILHYEKYINVLVTINTHYIHSEIYDFNNEYEENKDITNFIKDYVNNFEVNKLPPKQQIIKPELSPLEENILNLLTNVTQNIIKKTLKLNNKDKKDKNLIIYGSYTSHLLNHDISYNDIDVYHSNSLKFLTIIMMLFYFILDIEVDIFKIPYVLGHLSLRYKEHHFLDCIYLDKYTLNILPSLYLKNICIVDPIVQMFNNFRMMSEIIRLSNVSIKKEENILKYSVLLNESNKTLNIDFKNLFTIKHPLNFELINSSFILINLSAGFQEFPEYKNLKKIKKFDYLIISFTEPKILFKIIENRDDLRISKQYFALFNEICIEFENRNKNKILKKRSDNFLQNKVNIQETNIEILSKKLLYQFPNDLEDIINNNNVLLMTNISTNLYIKNYITKEKICEKSVISNISKETILSSFTLYNIIKKNDFELNKFYIKYFLSFLKNNKKQDEFKLFENKSDYEKIIKHKKIKICGNHETFSIKTLNYKNIFFFNLQDKDYYTYDEFILLTNYNENLKIK